MIDGMEERAQALVWSIEGSARFMHKKDIFNIAGLLREIGRQPGIAWLALVNQKGRIMLDNNEELNNTPLYSPAEMHELAAGNQLQGRFSPDDPQIYETWKLFQPGKLGNIPRNASNYVIFIAIDATGFHDSLKSLALRLWLFALAVSCALLCLAALSFYIHNLGQSRKKLAETEAFARQIIASYPAALLVCSLKGIILFYNNAARKMFDIPDNCQSDTLNDLAFFDWNHIFRSLSLHSPLPEEDIDLHLKNGQHKSVSLSAALVHGPGEPDCLMVFKDLDEIRQLQKKLIQSEKLSQAGRLASGLAHEIRNPLSSIRGYAHYLQSRLENDPMAKTAATLLVEETGRINNALTGLLSIVREPQLNLSSNPLPELLEKTAALVQPDADRQNVKIRINLPSGHTDGPWPLSDKDKMLQAFLNLMLNALQAMPTGGEIKISLIPVEDKNKRVTGWEIKFRDNGNGMTEEIRKQIFTPYFTTRAEGTGLGLAITKQIFESHKGSIEAASHPGNGTVFTIYLPLNANSNNER